MYQLPLSRAARRIAFACALSMLAATPAEARHSHASSKKPNAQKPQTTPNQSPAQAEAIKLTSGAQKPLMLGRALQRVAVGDPAVADVLVLKGNDGVMLVGKAPGNTDVMLWEPGRKTPLTWHVQVESQASAALVDGATPTVNVLGNTALVQGSAATMETHERAVAAAKASVGKDGAVVDTSIVATKSVVQVDVKVVEFSKSVLKEAGFNLFSQNNAGFAFGTFAPSSLGSASRNAGGTLDVTSASPIGAAFNLLLNSSSRGLFANLSLLESNNLARVLAQPTLVALSGQSANFLAGGEIPVPVPQSLGTTTITYKPYGVGLTLTPTVLGPHRIALKVAPEASQLDFAHAITLDGVSVPALTTRRAETTVELGDGESFVIGGLVDRETASNVSKVPLLGDLPIIGTFFKTLQYSQTDRELVILVTPHLVTPIAKGAVVPPLPGASEQRDGNVWRSFAAGAASDDEAPGFSK
ncbi:type II and III secretion system protein family protein [Caballeronia sp. LP006]|uniref:type II and III secretion system protein family protein n=1 Tax=Caballeronia sp. LP006 TaxID=3038552 RepID=UPI002861C115|nr:type II and III secretion system protein family protein [Caballeronia sp. LP006]MDR5826872.1 type II and III secretion system protein family protein [Caballeronia sp. LP006]